jgi:hypothetical protein
MSLTFHPHNWPVKAAKLRLQGRHYFRLDSDGAKDFVANNARIVFLQKLHQALNYLLWLFSRKRLKRKMKLFMGLPVNRDYLQALPVS